MSVPYSSFNPISLGNLVNVKIDDTTLANGNTIVYNSTTGLWNNGVEGGEVPLTFSTGLTRTVNTITNNLSTGVVGGQTAIGGTGITDILKLKGTTGNGTSASPAIQAIVGNNGATTALTILNSGNVGIGTTTPSSKLHIEEPTTTSGSAGINAQKTGTITGNSYGIIAQTTGAGTTNYGGFFTASGATNNYGLVVSAGNVGIGTTAPTNLLNVKGGLVPLKIEPTGSATDGVNLTLSYSGLTFNTTAPSYKTFTIENSLTADVLGLMNFNNGGSTRMTIANAGNVLIGSTTDQGSWKLQANGNLFIRGSDSLAATLGLYMDNSSGTSLFTVGNTGIATFGQLGTGTVSATAGVLSAVSDSRLKDEDGFITDALTKVLALQPRYFKWKTDNSAGLPSSVRQLGFFAQEVQSALGEEVVNTPPEGGNYGIHDRGIIAMLTKAVQEQNDIIINLMSRIIILENK